MDLRRRALLTRGSVKQAEPPLRMPWTVAEAEFLERCTRCHACTDHCPENIIRRGDGGFPEIHFSEGECTFCRDCADHCPEPLFTAASEPPWHLTLSISAQCLTNEYIVCQSCRDACAERVISFPVSRGVSRPVVDVHACTGCGACIGSCPVRAITLHKQSTVTADG